MEIFKDVEVWVGLGLIVFFAILAFARVPGAAGKALDARSDAIRSALEEAKRLQAEALAMLEELKAKRVQAEADAAQMLKDAELEARQLEADAHAKLDEQIRRRTELADRRIALAEAQAAQEVKAAAADLAAAAAEAVLAGRVSTAGAGGDPLVDRAVGQLAQRLQ